MSGITVDVMNEEIMLGAWNWFDELLKADAKLSAGTYVLIEVMQPVSGSGFEKVRGLLTFILAGRLSFDQIET